MDIMMMQTSDAEVYKPILDLTSRVNLLYSKRHNIRYECYIGIKSGVVPWHAVYNRIFMLHEVLSRGFAGWVMYLDADAFMADLDFDIRDYLAENERYCLIGAVGGEQPWNINSGVFFLNLGDEEGRQLVADYLACFHDTIPASCLTSPEAKWDDYPDDQPLLHSCISKRPTLAAKTKKEEWGVFNYAGRFIKQATRQMLPDPNARIDWIRGEIERVIASAITDLTVRPN